MILYIYSDIETNRDTKRLIHIHVDTWVHTCSSHSNLMWSIVKCLGHVVIVSTN